MRYYDFVALDFETANSDISSACSIGLAMVKDNKIENTFHSLIRPQALYFDQNNITVHGITEDDVLDAPEFPAVWEQIKDAFDDEILVAHNAQFDMSVLNRVLKSYQLSLPDFKYVCSISISSVACDHSAGKSLKDVANYFGIDMEKHHNAISDAVTCAEIVLKSIDATNSINFDNFCMANCTLPVKNFHDLKAQKSFGKYHKFESIKMSDIHPSTDDFDDRHPLYSKSIVFTGELEYFTRRTAMQLAADVGAHVKSAVSRKTDYLVVGSQDNSIVGDDGMSNKEEKAYALIEDGYNIKIVSEQDFMKLYCGIDE